MTDIRRLLEKMAWQEADFRQTPFLAPCVRGGRVRAKVGGLVQTFAPSPAEFEGWGVFRASAAGAVAQVEEEADLPLIAEYLGLFPALRVWLARPLSGQTWLAYPSSEGDMRQRFRAARPIAVHLVTEGMAFEQAVIRGIGGAWWFEEVDRRADPMAAESLREALRGVTEPAQVRFKGFTPEMRVVYDLVSQHDERFVARRREEAERRYREDRERLRQERLRVEPRYVYRTGTYEEPPRAVPQTPGQRASAEARLRGALRTGGGSLRDYSDRGEYWLVEWTTRDGERHTSAIAKADLTVISSGVCLSGRDHDFDLQSLVAVIEKGTWEW
jgi:hypothetical protein